MSFGAVRTDIPVLKQMGKGGVANYTFGLTRSNLQKSSTLYFDNFVVQELQSGKQLKYLIHYEPEENWYYNKNRDLANYSGRIKIYNIQAELVGNMNIANGELLPVQQQKMNDILLCMWEVDSIWCIGDVNGGDNYSCYYHYTMECSSGSSGGGGSTFEDIPYETPSGGSWENDPTGGGSESSSTPGDPAIDTQPLLIDDRETVDDKIDSDSLNECHSKLIDILKTVESGIVGQMIQKLAGSNSTNYNWNIDYNMPLGSNPNATASTDPIASSNSIGTHINLNRIQNSTDLSMARTFVHESIHAFLAYQYRNDSSSSDLNYTKLLNKYANQYNTNANDTHHILYLKENLIGPIADALQQFGAKLGYNLSTQYYEDMAYGGLYASSTTNTLFENLVSNQNDRDRIKNRLSAETDNLTINGVSPKGEKACN
jgi:hypothetical protein